MKFTTVKDISDLENDKPSSNPKIEKAVSSG